MVHYLKNLFVICFCCFYLNNACAEDRVAIFTKGKGGDYNSGQILTNRIKQANIKIEPYNLSDKLLSEISLKDTTKVILLGHGTVNEFLQKFDANNFTNKDVFVYSHLYSKELINFIKNIATTTQKQVVVYVTESQLYNFEVKLPSNIQIVSSPLVINSYYPDAAKNLFKQNSSQIKQIIANQTIHLGGSYYNSENNLVQINDNDIKNALKKLPLGKKQVTSVILHPRIFMDFKTADGNFILDKVLSRINFIRKVVALRTNDKVRIFLPQFIKQKIDKVAGTEEIFATPNYDSIIFAINNLQKEINIGTQFISADQYNAFANIKIPVYPFLLKPDDKEQGDYILSYRNLLNSKDKKLGDTYILDSIAANILSDS